MLGKTDGGETANVEHKTFILLWNGDDDVFSERVEAIDRTAEGSTVLTQWSFGKGYGDPRAGDRVYLHRTGRDNGIVASGTVLSDGVEWDVHWSDPDRLAPYLQVAWDVVVETVDRLPYAAMQDAMPEFNFPILGSGRRVYESSELDLNRAWEAHIGDLARRDGNPWLGGRPTGAKRRKSGPCPLESHATKVYDVQGFTSARAVKSESELVERFVAELTDRGNTVTGYRIQHPGQVRPLRADLYDQTERVLYEAKASASREAVRMAVGQLLDYRRGVDPETRLRLLLPERPADDLVELLADLQITCIYETETGMFEKA